MQTYHVLFNPHAGNGKCAEEVKKLDSILAGNELDYFDMTEIKSYRDLFSGFCEDDKIIIAGGDGTLNRFVNDIGDLEIKNDILYFATGSGNDFLHDLNLEKGSDPICINQYIKGLPVVVVNGKKYKFINGIGYGIDGYCCEVGDKLREIPGKKVNYTSIAIKGLLFHYHPTNATVTVDGVEHKYKKVWLAPTMNGHFYGGGIMPTPEQDRLSDKGNVSTLVMFGSGRLKTLIAFPSIFKGEHVKRTDIVNILSGDEVCVRFDRPTALQIDGETILGVTEYTVYSRKLVSEKTVEFV